MNSEEFANRVAAICVLIVVTTICLMVLMVAALAVGLI